MKPDIEKVPTWSVTLYLITTKTITFRKSCSREEIEDKVEGYVWDGVCEKLNGRFYRMHEGSITYVSYREIL